MKSNFKKLSMAITAASLLIASSLSFAASGEDLYKQQCSVCHGATGSGDGPLAGQNNFARPRAFTESARERMTIEKAMMEGVSNTPGHGRAQLFTAEELRALIDHVHKLANP